MFCPRDDSCQEVEIGDFLVREPCPLFRGHHCFETSDFHPQVVVFLAQVSVVFEHIVENCIVSVGPFCSSNLLAHAHEVAALQAVLSHDSPLIG